jgi:hypothetical protein
MRVRASGLGLFCLAMLFLGESSAIAAVTPIATTALQTDSIAPTVPNWSPTTPSLQGQNPLVFSQFNPALGQLQSVNLTMTFTTSEVVNMNFTTASTITLRSSSAQAPNAGPTITLNGPSGSGNLLTASAPVFTYTKTYGGPGQTLPQSFSNDTTKFQPGSPFFLTPNGQPNNLTSSFTGSKSLTITDPGQLSLFTGTGTVGLPAFATAGSFFSTTSGNGSGSILTFAGLTVTLSYTYVVPEPSSVALLGLGGGGILLAGGLRRRRAAV